MSPGSLCLRHIQLLRTFYVHCHYFLVYSSAFSVCFCNPANVLDIFTKSPANINADIVYSPTVTPCFAAVTATIMSFMYIPQINWVIAYTPVRMFVKHQHSSIFSSITALLAHSVIFFIILHMFSLYSSSQFPTTFSTTHFSIPWHGSSVHLARNSTLLAPRLSYLELYFVLPNVYTWFTQLWFGLNPACPSIIFSSFSITVPILSFKILPKRFAYGA